MNARYLVVSDMQVPFQLDAAIKNIKKLVNAFISKSLPFTWADKNINFDFNDRAFINLIDYAPSNYEEICSLIKDDYFLKKFSTEPLLLKKPDLDKEKKFISQILSKI
jgi:hypothetical protein